MTWDRWAAMGCVWAAVAVFITDAVITTRGNRRLTPNLPVAAPALAEVVSSKG